MVSKASENRMGYFSRINSRAEKNKQQIHYRKKGERARKVVNDSACARKSGVIQIIRQKQQIYLNMNRKLWQAYPVMSCIIRSHISSDFDKFVTNGRCSLNVRARTHLALLHYRAVKEVVLLQKSLLDKLSKSYLLFYH